MPDDVLKRTGSVGKECGKMPSKKEYDLVSDDGYDSRIPLHNEDAFQHGIQFQAKYIGTLDVPRPSSRVEIVAAMRRIRYEFKAKAIKKKKINISISVEGVKVCLRNKKKKLSQWSPEDKKLMVVTHPIYRIFYVSHDSQDLKIWSYIARDGPSNVFKCNVFKSYKKEQAMRIVRTIGQAFEVCHKLSLQSLQVVEVQEESEGSTQSADTGTDKRSSKSKDTDDRDSRKRDSSIVETPKGRATPPNELALRQAQQLLYQMAANTPVQIGGTTITSPMSSSGLLDDTAPDPELPLSSHHQLQLLRQQAEQQQQQTHVAVAQVHLLKDQLAAETAARIEAQARAHQLLLQNRDLLEHMNQILTRLQDLEMKTNGVEGREITHTTVSQTAALPDPTTPQCGPVYLPSPMSRDLEGSYITGQEICLIENPKTVFDTDSPDSGHREMSSESLSTAALQNEMKLWGDSQDKGVKYSYGFSSPVKFQNTAYEMTAMVNSNPFANHEDFGDREAHEGIKEGSAKGKHELKLNLAAPKLKPPPEFRNSESHRNSQISDSSNSDTNSLKDGIVTFPDSDYYSHTGSSTRTNAHGDDVHFIDNREVKTSTMFQNRAKLEYHYNNFVDEPLALQKYFEEESHYDRRGSYSDDEDNTESLDETIPHPPSPPPPPRRLETLTFDEFDALVSS